MSKIVTTKLGRFRAVTDGAKKSWLWECPECKTWGSLSVDQMEGRVSVYCTAPKQRHYPTRVDPCGYHQTHEFAKELATTIQARMIMGEEPWAEDNDGPKPSLLNQEVWDRDYRKLAALPAVWHGVSAEPLLGPISIGDARPDWIITGGESGPRHRFTDPAWVRSLRDQCAANGVAYHHKQWGGVRPKENGCAIDGREHKDFPAALAA